MCSDPQNIYGNEVACGKCNRCIAARKNDWVARAMAEKATSGETLAIELTYRQLPGDVTPDGAKVFRYDHVQNFFKRLRDAYFQKYGKRGEIRYICAGERGSRNNRVHWHIVVFAVRPISVLGNWTTYTGKPLKQMRQEKRDHWSFWDHGFVYAREPDQGGMAYTVKYAIKEQFGHRKSVGTMRESKSERYAASCFRMSKKPPIGAGFLEGKLADWKERGVVPTSLKIRVPDYSGYWWPKGKLRERLLEGIREINDERKERTGRPAPQFSMLLASCLAQTKDWEGLFYGDLTEEEAETLEEAERAAQERDVRENEQRRKRRQQASEVIRNCGGLEVCRTCYRSLYPQEKESYRRWYHEQTGQFVTRPVEEGAGDPDGWFRAKGRTNPFCSLRDAEGTLEAHFARYGTS